MPKAVMISIKPKWCELIANHKKTVEVRKSKPKLETPFKVYIYCTQGEALATPCLNVPQYTIHRINNGTTKGRRMTAEEREQSDHSYANGKVIGEFVCNQFTYIEAGYDTNGNKHLYNTAFIEHRMCIPDNELHEYLYKSREKCSGWAWHISNLKIYEKPRNLNDFHKCGAASMDDLLESEKLCTYCSDTNYGEFKCCGTPSGPVMCEGRFCDSAYQEYLDDNNFTLGRPPQSWCYVEEVEQA